MTRRKFLALITGFFSFLLLPKRGLALSQPEMSDEDILRGLLDALIPSDGTPGAKDVNLYEKLNRLVSGDSRKKRNYREGLSRVRSEVNRFKGKDVDWDSIMDRISLTPFFAELKVDAMRLFYSEPVVWKTIGYEGPPMRGYYDYHKCK